MGASPCPLPEVWLDALETDLVAEPVGQGPALQQGESLAGEWQPGGRAPPEGGGRKGSGSSVNPPWGFQVDALGSSFPFWGHRLWHQDPV